MVIEVDGDDRVVAAGGEQMRDAELLGGGLRDAQLGAGALSQGLRALDLRGRMGGLAAEDDDRPLVLRACRDCRGAARDGQRRDRRGE